jgi:hypothetical protein
MAKSITKLVINRTKHVKLDLNRPSLLFNIFSNLCTVISSLISLIYYVILIYAALNLLNCISVDYYSILSDK